MILREFFYIDQTTLETEEDKFYDPSSDSSVLDKSDKRKTRLTLRQINKARKAAEAHKEMKAKDLSFIKQMYGIAANAETV